METITRDQALAIVLSKVVEDITHLNGVIAHIRSDPEFLNRNSRLVGVSMIALSNIKSGSDCDTYYYDRDQNIISVLPF